jgi:hypothetical protein
LDLVKDAHGIRAIVLALKGKFAAQWINVANCGFRRKWPPISGT